MAQLTITVPDAVVPRIRTAFGHDSESGWVLATVTELQAAIRGYVQSRVRDYEGAAARAQAQGVVDDEVNSWQ